MKTIILFLTLILSLPALAIDRCMTGSYATEGVSHEGVNVEVLSENAVLAYWYTYRFYDRLEQNWLLFAGEPEHLTAYDILPESDDEYDVGTGSLIALDENTLQFAHDFRLELDQLDREFDPDTGTPYCLEEQCAAVYTLKRLTQPIACGDP